MMVITYRNFSTSSFVITSWWSLHTATFPLLPMVSLHDDYYVPQLFHFFFCDNFMMIITYHNFSTFSFAITSWDYYIPQLFHFFLSYHFMMIITYRNFSTSSSVITSWWSLHTTTFPFLPLLKLHDDHYISQLFHFFLCYHFMMIITYRNFSTSSFVIASWWSLHTPTFPLPPLL